MAQEFSSVLNENNNKFKNLKNQFDNKLKLEQDLRYNY